MGAAFPRYKWSINGRFLTQPMTGVQRYALEVVRQLDECLQASEPLRQTFDIDLLVPSDCASTPRLGAIPTRWIGHGRGYLWEQAVLPLHCRGGLINLANLGPIAQGRRQITCIHDANVFVRPESYSRRFRAAYRLMLPALGSLSGAVTTVSDFSAHSLQAAGVAANRRLHRLPNGHEHALSWNAAASKYFNAPRERPFILALGSRARHKNLDLLLAIAAELDAAGVDILIAGGSAALFAEAGASRPLPNVSFLGYVGDDDLAALFSKALCFAFPSWTEGFGLPLLEAMTHGCPIVSSNAASMPEVCGDAALFAAPWDAQAWLDAIKRLKEDPALRMSLAAAGRRRYPLFSWRNTALGYLRLAMTASREAEARRAGAALPAQPSSENTLPRATMS